MDPASPPKRVTRARAATTKTAAEPTIKIATAATRAKAVKGAAATTKRKTRSEDPRKEDEEQTVDNVEPEKPKKTRGRPKKVVSEQIEEEMSGADEPQSPPRTKTTRGRAKKTDEADPSSAPEPAKSTRTRAKKTTINVEEDSTVAKGPTTKATRGRPATTTNLKPALKKTVKFEDTHEPDKENVVPTIIVKGKGKEPTVGIKAKPVRKPAVPTRATRARPKPTTTEKPAKDKSPLSPKKATQVATARDISSEDELATMEKTPMRPLSQSPLKAPASAFGAAKRLDFTASASINRALPAKSQDLSASMMASPARRPPHSTAKEPLLASPKRTNLGDSLFKSPMKFSRPGPARTDTEETLKASLLQSPAKRPISPVKGLAASSPNRTTSFAGSLGTPKASTFSISRFATPRTLTKSAFRPGRQQIASVTRPATEKVTGGSGSNHDPSSIKPFPGRLSAVLPRHADPFMRRETMEVEPTLVHTDKEDNASAEGIIENQKLHAEEPAEEVPVDDIAVGMNASTTPIESPPRHSTGNFGLRQLDENTFHDSDSEDELTSYPMPGTPTAGFNPSTLASTPTPFAPISKTPRQNMEHRSSSEQMYSPAKSESMQARREGLGFTPLAQQLSDWMASSPEKREAHIDIEQATSTGGQSDNLNVSEMCNEMDLSPSKSTFFEDEMVIREDAVAVEEPLEAIEFAPSELDAEDLALAAEADEMSLLEPEVAEDAENLLDMLENIANEDVLSQASQEYGDENVMIIDPQLIALDATPVVETSNQTAVYVPKSAVLTPVAQTPVRILKDRVFHTVSKVPLKAAAENSPMRDVDTKRSASVSRLPPQRGVFTSREETLSTPTKSSDWSVSATPNRTPRRDLNNQILKGAIVFVDVHTTEGADASAVFVELLSQMGAKCVKSWTWNPNSSSETSSPESDSSTSSSKVGITHVVYKDGGKRTLEKVRESNGVVLCVGVGWVLDCERNNTWMEESPYNIDTGLIPRGGARRRKSMEPRALANMNGTLVSTPARATSAGYSMSPRKESLNTGDMPGSIRKVDRRASTAWVRSPRSESDEGNNDDFVELSPVPATPAPEAVSAYAESLLNNEDFGAETPYFTRPQDLVQMTAPPKQTGRDEMNTFGVVNEDGSGRVLMQRLMLARRKSLQWAPKVGSPLARAASYGS